MRRRGRDGCIRGAEAHGTMLSRRQFICATTAIGGGLALVIALPAAALEGSPAGSTSKAGPAGRTRPPSAFLQIAENNAITVISPAVEMGQGGHTAMSMIVLDELGGDWRLLQRVEDAPAAAVYDNPGMGSQTTAASFSVRGWYTELRRVGAAAREMLVQAAARAWEVPASECSVRESVITHRPSGRTRTFGSVANAAARLAVPQDPPLKDPDGFTLIGKSAARVDVPAKVDGSARYGIDVRLPGMLYAAIKSCPTLGGRLKGYDDSAAKRMPGYHATVPLPDGVMAVAQTYWQAKKALDAVKAEYDPGPLANLDSAKVSQLLHQGFGEPGEVARNDGDVERALATAATTLEAVYEVPYLAHACMEPMNCTASINGQGGEVWCGTQAPQAAQSAAAAVLGVSPSLIKVHTQYLGGGFGRRGQPDYVTQAMTAAKAVQRPVKLIWSREEDIQHDFYRPAAAIRFHAGLDRAGTLVALDCHVVTSSAPPSYGRPGPSFTGSISNMSYSIPNLRVTGVDKRVGVRFGYWRSVNESHNPFMLEGFIDELAHHTGQDPYLFRRPMLKSTPRQLAVLDLLAEKANWTRPRPGRHLGIAALHAYGAFTGTVFELAAHGRLVTLHRVITAIDCGVAVDPANARAQLESGMVYGLTAALWDEITLDQGSVQQSNFDNYPVLKLAQMPPTENYIVPSTEAPGGVGEPGAAGVTPALVNALYGATGRRVRTLPLSRQGFTFTASRT
jgi:isoquinoline 1-oxidoreductase beta subunit